MGLDARLVALVARDEQLQFLGHPWIEAHEVAELGAGDPQVVLNLRDVGRWQLVAHQVGQVGFALGRLRLPDAKPAVVADEAVHAAAGLNVGQVDKARFLHHAVGGHFVGHAGIGLLGGSPLHFLGGEVNALHVAGDALQHQIHAVVGARSGLAGLHGGEDGGNGGSGGLAQPVLLPFVSALGVRGNDVAAHAALPSSTARQSM